MPVTSVDMERGDGWTILTLASPAGLNKLGSGTLGPLYEAVSGALGEGIRCLGITGKGGSFAVGADLNEIRQLDPHSARRFSDKGNSIFRLLERSDAAVVAGIDGFCLGGGLDLALSADWLVASEGSVFGHPGADLGLITGFGGTQRLPRLIGHRHASRYLLTGRRFGAAQARRLGLVQELCPPEALQETFRRRVAAMAQIPAGAFRGLKQGLLAGMETESLRSMDGSDG